MQIRSLHFKRGFVIGMVTEKSAVVMDRNGQPPSPGSGWSEAADCSPITARCEVVCTVPIHRHRRCAAMNVRFWDWSMGVWRPRWALSGRSAAQGGTSGNHPTQSFIGDPANGRGSAGVDPKRPSTAGVA